VPVEVKEQGNALLKKIDATHTQLINAAYQYLLDTEELPVARPALKHKKRLITEEVRRDLEKTLARTLVSNYDYSEGGTRSFKEALAAKKRADYEASA
jgi:antitoxin component of RelBE/YafQ-DinJ toxin-antitoxin module